MFHEQIEKPVGLGDRSRVMQAKYHIGSLTLAFVDYGAVILAIISTWFLRTVILPAFFPSLMPFHISDKYVLYFIPIVYLILLMAEGMYTKRLPFWQSAEIVFKVSIYATLVIILLMFFLKMDHTSRIFIALSWLFSFLYLSVFRYSTKRFLADAGFWKKPIVVVGAAATAQVITKSFAEQPNIGYEVVGLIEDQSAENPMVAACTPVIGSLNNIEDSIIHSGVKDVIIAAPGLSREQLINLVYRIQPLVEELKIVPDLSGLPIGNLKTEMLFMEKILMLSLKNNLEFVSNQIVKRLFDIVIGSITFVVTGPVMLLIAVLIKLESPGPAMHTGNRLGRKGKEFACYKFRTMHVHGDELLEQYLAGNSEAREEWEHYAKLRGYDPRVTRVGKWLRKLSLDELPQLFNVILGDMSLVGPRPYLPREKDKMGKFYNTILTTVPGITGLWQVSGRNQINFDGRLALDSWYVRNWSVWLDFELLVKTVKVVLGRKGAY